MGIGCGACKKSGSRVKLPQPIGCVCRHRYFGQNQSHSDDICLSCLNSSKRENYTKWNDMVNFAIEEDETPVETTEFISLSGFALIHPQEFSKQLTSGPDSHYRWIAWKTALRTQDFFVPRKYACLLAQKTNSKYLEIISNDAKRTFQGYEYNKESLENILIAYEFYNPTVGYCQGMNYIAGILLIVSESKEEESFWAFVALMEKKTYFERLNSPGINTLYVENFPLVKVYAKLFEYILSNIDPKLKNKLVDVGLPDELWIHKWICSLFIYIFPREYCIRLWYSLLANGISFVLPLISIIMKKLAPELMKSTTMEKCYQTLKLPIEIIKEFLPNPDEIIKEASELILDWKALDEIMLENQSLIFQCFESKKNSSNVKTSSHSETISKKHRTIDINSPNPNDQSTQSADKVTSNLTSPVAFRIIDSYKNQINTGSFKK